VSKRRHGTDTLLSVPDPSIQVRWKVTIVFLLRRMNSRYPTRSSQYTHTSTSYVINGADGILLTLTLHTTKAIVSLMQNGQRHQSAMQHCSYERAPCSAGHSVQGSVFSWTPCTVLRFQLDTCTGLRFQLDTCTGLRSWTPCTGLRVHLDTCTGLRVQLDTLYRQTYIKTQG
jgi:hypothetical protein